jgi:hypothetical protein
MNGKALLVSENAMKATPVKEIFGDEFYSDLESVFFAPLKNQQDCKGILVLVSQKNLEEKLVREINGLINLG